MTRDEIVDMVAAVDFQFFGKQDWNIFDKYEAFAKLVAEKERERMTVVAMDAAEEAVDVAMKLEREACAKVCDEYDNGRHANAADLCAIAIRARGQA